MQTNPGCLGYMWAIMIATLPNYMDQIIINRFKDPYITISIMECHKSVFFRGSIVPVGCRGH